MLPHFALTPVLRKITFLTISLFTSFIVFCQPDYDFRNPVLISGTDLQINAVYLFQNVKPGVDATVTIKDITGTIYLSDIDGGSGYVEALQPVLQVPPLGSGYVEFEVNFLFAGTNTPMVQTEVPATPIDVDGQDYGDGVVKEFDVLELSNGYVNYDMLGGELNMDITGTWVTGRNVAGVDYPGVDTTPRQVMFTTVNAGISTFTFRSGATSTSLGTRQRLRSVYFKKFAYNNAYLSTPSLISFSGAAKDDKIALLWSISSVNSLKKVVIEKSYDLVSFSYLADVLLQQGNNTLKNYNFTDNGILHGTTYYRLKMTTANEVVQYSNLLIFHTGGNNKQSFKIYPSVISDNATINILSEKNEQTSLQLFDMNGHAVYKKKIELVPGSNTITVYGLGMLQQGTYIASVKAGTTTHSQKIMVR
ncbi:MAG: T9SS type A sorting domain-containing protein [Chitinophagaceae bacterium]